ncbi:MAG: hypothetical protein JWM80_2531 [Cyanobacteria bacterium RYN_339]|nr:hypothetical protein [Cyanobacteria bacterium RYN_339]
MSEMSMNRPSKGHEEIQAYPDRTEDFDAAAESYRLPEEAVFIGTEGERPEDAMGDVEEDLTGDQIFEAERPD